MSSSSAKYQIIKVTCTSPKYQSIKVSKYRSNLYISKVSTYQCNLYLYRILKWLVLISNIKVTCTYIEYQSDLYLYRILKWLVLLQSTKVTCSSPICLQKLSARVLTPNSPLIISAAQIAAVSRAEWCGAALCMLQYINWQYKSDYRSMLLLQWRHVCGLWAFVLW